jgi:murein DD-endopeptidase MepM/ murein hydrolase activator NlpD
VKSKYTFLIIPPNHAPTRQIQFSTKGKQILIYGFVTLGLFIVGVFSLNVYLSHTLKVQKAEIDNVNQLKSAIEEKDKEINKLKEDSLQMAQDLSTIRELELKISTILKVDTPTSAAQLSQEIPPSSSMIVADPEQISKQVTVLKEYYNIVTQNENEINHTPSILPVDGEIASPFGNRRNPFGRWTSEFHNGVDFAVGYGTPVRATAAGIITFANWDVVYGRKVEINHGNGIETFYGHNSRLLVKVGDTVKKGDIIAYSGNSGRSTGAHLHYGAIVNGKSIDPLQFTNFKKEQ